MTISDDTRLIACDTTIAKDLDDATVLVELSKGTYFGVEGVGQRVWELLQSPQTPKSISTALLVEYDVTEDVLKKDVAAFLKMLQENGLVEPAA